jgi:hypothetical protein
MHQAYIISLDVLTHYLVNPSIGTTGTVSVPLKSLFLVLERGEMIPYTTRPLGHALQNI